MAEDQVAAMEERSMGRVVKFNDARGFGFIKPDDGGEELFVHHSAISSDGGYRTLSTGDVVEFSVAFSDNKYQAVDVTAPGGVALLPSRRDVFSSRRSGSGFGSTRRSNGGGCYNCGSRDHLARDCDRGNQNNSGGGGCFKCGETGHFARDCNRSGDGFGGGACFNCGRYGHMARDCGGGGGSGCYNCGGYGHLARDCSSARVGGRFGGGGGGGGSGGCFNCGQAGHFARECPSNA